MRPTGALHLGHYHGVLKNWVRCRPSIRACSSSPTGTRSPPTTTSPGDIEQNAWDMVIDWLAAGVDPSAGDAVHPVAGARARRAAPAAVDDDAARLAGARADLQGPAGEAGRQGPLDLRLPRLSAAAVGRHPDLPRQVRAGGRGPGAARRVHARGRAPLQPPLRPRAGLRGQGQGGGEEDGHARRRACSTSCAPSSWSRATPRRSKRAQALLDEQQNLPRGDRERLFGWLEGGGKKILVEPEALLTEASQACRASTARRCRSPTATPSRCARSPKSVAKKIRTMPTDPARVKRTDPGNPEKCPVWQLHQVYSDEAAQEVGAEGLHAPPASAASSASSR